MDAPVHLTPKSRSWPRELDEIDAPPDELWARGRVERLGVRPRVAIVGSRSPTPYGEAQAQRFGAGLARAGVCVVSGLARGVDQAAHAGVDVAGFLSEMQRVLRPVLRGGDAGDLEPPPIVPRA